MSEGGEVKSGKQNGFGKLLGASGKKRDAKCGQRV